MSEKRSSVKVTIVGQELTIRSDATKLRQILINLLGNAVKFTDSGNVCLAVRDGGDEVVFTVSDTGPGITASDRERVFDAFTQLDQSLKRPKGGTGLGLPVSRKLAHLLGGDLTVDGAPSGGAVFTLSLPVAAPTPAYPEAQVTERSGR